MTSKEFILLVGQGKLTGKKLIKLANAIVASATTKEKG